MSAFHRVDDIRTMPALRFINFAIRLSAYKGVIRALAEKEAHDEQSGRRPARGRPARQYGGDIRQNRVVASDAATLRTDAAFAGMIEVKGGTVDG